MPVTRELPEERQALTHKFVIAGIKGYITLGFYDDGSVGEVFLRVSKEGSTVGGLVGGWAISVSKQLQHGIPPLEVFRPYIGERFEPMGHTPRGYATSIYDYVSRFILDIVVPDWKVKLTGP